jgi:hypothetical protein
MPVVVRAPGQRGAGHGQDCQVLAVAVRDGREGRGVVRSRGPRLWHGRNGRGFRRRARTRGGQYDRKTRTSSRSGDRAPAGAGPADVAELEERGPGDLLAAVEPGEQGGAPLDQDQAGAAPGGDHGAGQVDELDIIVPEPRWLSSTS